MPPAALAAIIGTFGIPALITVVVLVARAVSAARRRRQSDGAGAAQGGLSRPAFWAIWITVGLICLGFVLYAVLSGGADFS